MKRSMPMYVRILLFLALNLVVVALLLGWVLKSYYGFGKDSLISNTVESRMEGMVRLLRPALVGADRSEWDGILKQTGSLNGVELALMSPDGVRRHAGSERELPQELAEALLEKFEPRPDRPGPRRRPEIEEGDEMDSIMDGEPPGGLRAPRGEGPGRRAQVSRPDDVIIESIGKFGSPKKEMAAVHFWIKPGNRKPHDLMLVVWKTDSASQVFFSWTPLICCLIGLLVLTAIIWVPFVYRITRRLGILTKGAESISEGNFEIDVASDRGDELGQLSRSVQRMAVRLDEYVTGQKRFLGDIAHELCSPLVRVRMGLGVLEHQLEKEEMAKLSNINEEVEELSQLVNELLDFSKASMRPATLELEDVDIRGLCEVVTVREAGDSDIHIHVAEGLMIRSRHDLLRRAIGNLVRNAVRYAGSEGEIRVSALAMENSVSISVEDSGPGLPEPWLEKVFEPFSRPDEARAREAGGSGLGMAIAKTCVTSLGGKIHCENRKTGGLRVMINLPASGS